MKNSVDQEIESIVRFTSYLKLQRRCSFATVTSYVNDLNQFNKYVKETFDQDLLKVERSHVRSWIAAIKAAYISSRSINRKISTLRTFYRYCRKTKLISEDPMKGIPLLKISKNIPVIVSETQMAKILYELKYDNEMNLRESLIITLLYYTGMRKAELCDLKVSDFDTANKTLRISGKGGNQRLVPIENKFIDQLQLYLNYKVVKSEYLLSTPKGEKLYKKFVYNIVKKIFTKVYPALKVSPHILRHSMASHLLNNGASINAISLLLGHASQASTQIYLHNNIERLKRNYCIK